MRRIVLTPTALLLWLLPACGTYLALDEPFDEPPPTPEIGPYRIAIGDELELEFARVFLPVEEYRLGVGDEIYIDLHGHRELEVTTAIGPDGTVSYHRLGVLPAAGLTVEELDAAISEGLAAHYVTPEVSVFLLTSDTATERFVEMLLLNPSGSTRTVVVANAGHVSIPGVGAIKVDGLTIAEAEDLMNRRLQEYMPSVQVLVNTSKDANARYSVVGEVSTPGSFSMSGTTTLVKALAAAGWETEYGDMSRVLVMSPAADGMVDALIYDVENALLHGNTLPRVRVRPGDTVMVLRTGVGNSNEAIAHYITNHLPVRVGVGYRLDRP